MPVMATNDLKVFKPVAVKLKVEVSPVAVRDIPLALARLPTFPVMNAGVPDAAPVAVKVIAPLTVPLNGVAPVKVKFTPPPLPAVMGIPEATLRISPPL